MNIKNLETIKLAQKNAKSFLVELNKYFLNDLKLEQDRSDPMFTFYWLEDSLIADIGIDLDTNILIALIDSTLFEKDPILKNNKFVEFLPNFEDEKLMCIEVVSENELQLVKNLTKKIVDFK